MYMYVIYALVEKSKCWTWLKQKYAIQLPNYGGDWSILSCDTIWLIWEGGGGGL